MATKYDPETADPGQIEKIPAGHVIIDPNVRKDIRHDTSFVSSIRVLGFQQHPVGYRDGDHVHITVGQRRISAALEIGWPVIPIVIKPKRDAEADRAEELRLLEQIAENEHRAPLTPAELTAGYKQLALLGVTEDQIARKTNSPKLTVQTALAVAESPAAFYQLKNREITLEQAALIVEFENDADAVTEITNTLTDRPEQIDHTVARLRNDREAATFVDARATVLEADGWTVHREKQHYGWETPEGTAPWYRAWRTGDEHQQSLALDDATLTDRHAVIYPAPWRDDHVEVKYFIGNLAEQGLETWAPTSTTKGELTDDEKTARRQKRTDKADMILATEVRRTWIRAFLEQGKLPDMSRWIAHATFQTDDCLGHQARPGNARDLAWDLLGRDIPSTKYAYQSREASAKYIAQTTSLIADRLVAAYAIALAEDVLGDPKHPWAGTQPVELAPYLLQLTVWGYTLSDVEQRLVDAAKPKRKNAAGA